MWNVWVFKASTSCVYYTLYRLQDEVLWKFDLSKVICFFSSPLSRLPGKWEALVVFCWNAKWWRIISSKVCKNSMTREISKCHNKHLDIAVRNQLYHQQAHIFGHMSISKCKVNSAGRRQWHLTKANFPFHVHRTYSSSGQLFMYH